MSITAAELKNNHDRVETAKSLFGILPKNAGIEESKKERLGAKYKKGEGLSTEKG